MNKIKRSRPARPMKLRNGVTKDNLLSTMSNKYYSDIEGMRYNEVNGSKPLYSIPKSSIKVIRINYRDDDKGHIVVHSYSQLASVLGSVTPCKRENLSKIINNTMEDNNHMKTVYWKEFTIEIFQKNEFNIKGGYYANY